MLQSAIFADLQVNSFGIPMIRFAPNLPVIGWIRGSFSSLGRGRWFIDRAVALPQSEHLRRDIGLID